MQQQIEDARKHGIDLLLSMEHRWGSYLGRLIFEDCKEALRRPMQLLEVFEAAGKAAEEDEKYLSWMLPLTNFPVVQYYIDGTVKKIYVQYGPPVGPRLSTGYYQNTLQLFVSFLERPVPARRKQSQGAAPNVIHSLDAAHLMLVVHEANFDVVTVHDSFGSHPSDMPTLFTLVRKKFVELYMADPLSYIMTQINGDVSNVDFGALNIKLIEESEYCFS